MTTWQNASLSDEERVDALLAEMSLKEKIHQLASFWARDPEAAAPAPEPTGPEGEADSVEQGAGHEVAPMENAFAADSLSWEESIDGGLGHITRVWGTDPLELSEGAAKLKKMQAEVRECNAFGIPAIVHEECLTGFTAYRATVYPAAIAWGATWNPGLVGEMASRIGRDMHALGVHQGLSPLLDVVRDYRWGRVEETCGEDPYLVGTVGTAYVKGLQGAGVIATLKHFVGYPASRGGRNHAPVPMGPRELEDVMLPSFEMAVREGGVDSVMNSYSDIDGVPAAASRHLLTEVLRERWGFTGTTVSDYWSVRFLEKMHRIAGDGVEAAALALNAGLDVELPETTCYSGLAEAVERGLVEVADIDAAARRVLLQKARLGLLDAEWEPFVDESRDLDSPKNREVARRMAEESIVLLKNDGVLPLARRCGAVVIGPVWEEVRSFMGCYAFPNHVLARYEDGRTGLDIETLPEALGSVLDDPVFVRGTGFMEGTDEEIAEAVAAAKNSELAILTLGDIAGMFGEGTSGEGCDVASLDLPGRQGELLDAVLGTGTPVVLVLVTGRPYALGAYADRCAAVVQAFMPGVEGAGAITRVLSGEVSPSGRLPIAIPNTPGGQPGTYLQPPLGWESEGISNIDPRPLFPFGHGLSYTSVEYSSPSVSTGRMALDGTVEYSVTVTNTGGRAGAEVVQLYASDPVGEVVRPLKQLIGFAKVELAPGESARVTFEVHADRFSFTGVDMKRIVEGGRILLAAGRSSEERLPASEIELEPGRRIVGEGRVLTTPVRIERN
ncbi:glycoside hydrolase family 3 N-terminal domain-containing protein [Schaalia hyovaginalis]|uniref:Exo-alpha-(1->6)-L-arabinopyranosidase n=1 Tax=Schaalia hyovaginalis TaxID=29316 RepID=A0A923E295_9ACTO|nr:glycoside hydrolase family 3 N-terminal domain-containing protein [Schaalia hyovaginalis]MBB6333527.1 beta-glucosidase [Schaalia hyovaginalis]MDY2669063.1 glycoside hydrolase family 3 N-terminal domain-containing protein [Schaalia hyovaginalis]